MARLAGQEHDSLLYNKGLPKWLRNSQRLRRCISSMTPPSVRHHLTSDGINSTISRKHCINRVLNPSGFGKKEVKWVDRMETDLINTGEWASARSMGSTLDVDFHVCCKTSS